MHLDEGQNALTSYGGKRYVPIPLPAASAPTLAAAALSTKGPSNARFFGPGLSPGTYGYQFSLLWEDFEGAPGAESTVTWSGPGPGEVRITLPALPEGATGINVYGRTAGAEVLLARNAASQLSAATFVDQGQALDGRAAVPANSVFKRGGGRVHRIHVPGTGATPGNVKILDSADPAGAAALATIFGPTTPAAGSIIDLQVACRRGILIQSPAGMVYVVTYS
jgi:hypothetical protein